nr:MAG TPA: hypothetical protein [Caudoviricetes sp.]
MKALDLNKAKRQSFPVTMMDEKQTVFNLVMPNAETIKKLQTIHKELQSVISGDDADALDACYEVAAELLSCNRMQRKVTVDELKSDYKMEFEDLLLFFNAYMEFIRELTKSKN